MKLSCDIVKDLVGVCTDHAASDDTESAVQAHLAECPRCKKYYRDYAQIAARHRGNGNRPTTEVEDGYRALSLRIRKHRNTELTASIAAFVTTAALTGFVLYRIGRSASRR